MAPVPDSHLAIWPNSKEPQGLAPAIAFVLVSEPQAQNFKVSSSERTDAMVV